MRVSPLATLALTASALSALPAQSLPPEQVRAAGLGAIRLSFDASTPTGSHLLVGCAWLNGRYYVSGRDSAAPFHKVWVFDATGAASGQFNQVLSSATSDWGYRDGATDGVSLMFASEHGVHVIDTNGNLRPPAGAVVAANGPQNLLSNPIRGAALTALGTMRGLAFDPNGNGGRGSLWSGSFASDLIEFDLDGNILRTRSNPGVSIYGLAWDAAAGTLWVNARDDDGALGEIEPVSGALTSTRIPRYLLGSAPGGLALGPGGALVSLDQGAVDRVSVFRNHLALPSLLGKHEERLQVGINGGPLGDAQFRCAVPGATIRFGVSGATFPGGIHATLFNFGPVSLLTGTTMLFGSPVPELVAISDVSVPTGFNILLSGVNGAPASFTLPAGILLDRELIRMQSIYIGAGRVLASNQVYLEYAASPTARVRVEAVGHSSRDADPTGGFFAVSNLGNTTESIVRVVMTWVGSSNAAQATMTWDTDSEGMGGRFDGGNSLLPACRGTYRNGSDVATGLDYAASMVSPCDANARTGWIASDPTGPGDWRTLEFRFGAGSFVPGKVFEFDADTDRGQGFTGADMAGLRVAVTLSGGAVLTGELALDGASAIPRSFVDL